MDGTETRVPDAPLISEPVTDPVSQQLSWTAPVNSVMFPLASFPESGRVSADILCDGTILSKPKRKSPKKLKSPIKNGELASSDQGSMAITSPTSSITSSVIPILRQKSHHNQSLLFSNLVAMVPPRMKDKSLTYVNYLNAFSNSLMVHPPVKRGAAKGVGVPNTAKSSVEEEGKVITDGKIQNDPPSRQIVDFEHGWRLGATIPYIQDFDRDRCAHADSFCPFSKREGYAYCEKHLLDDKALPFVPCAFQRTEVNPCPYPARMPPGAGGKNRPQRSKEALCALHTEKCMQEVQGNMMSSANSILSTMDGLDSYNVNQDKGLPPTNVTDILDDLAEPQTREYLETYLRATAKETYASDSSSQDSAVEEKDIGLFTSKAFDTDDELDSEEEDPLKYAHTFTVEELARLLRCKLAKQRELLTAEVRLQEYKLKDARARYLTEVVSEKAFLPSVSVQARHSSESQKPYRNVRTMLRFNRRHPKFSFHHTRKPCIKLRHGEKLPESVSRCLHSATLPNGKTVKCKMYSLPFSRHCLSHILEDHYQYLYKRCAAEIPEKCSNPVLRSMGIKYCYVHADLGKQLVGPNLDESRSFSCSSEDEHEEISPLSTPIDNPRRQPKRRLSQDSPKTSPDELDLEEAIRVDDIFAKLEQQENIQNDDFAIHTYTNENPSGSQRLKSTIVDVIMSDL